MIRLALIVGLSFVLTIATLFIDSTEIAGTLASCDETAESEQFCTSVGVPRELSDKGFPVEFVDEKVEDFTFSSSFNLFNFGISWVFWIGVTSLAYLSAAFVMKQFGRVALFALLALYASGYSWALIGL